MASKNRTINNFVALVPDYVRSKSDKYESNLQRCLQVMCCMENLAIFDVSQPEVVEFFVSLRELLKACDGGIGWKAVELVGHLRKEPKILEFLCRLDLVPILAQYLVSGQPDTDKTVLLLSVMEPLTEGIVLERTGLWLTGLLKHMTQAILEKSDYTLPHLLSVLSNLCLENNVVVNELQRESRSDELLQYLVQLQATDPLSQLHAAQIVFSLLAVGSISEALLANYLATVAQLLSLGARTGRLDLIRRSGSVLLWMSRDRLVLDLTQAAKFQDLLRTTLEELVPVLEDKKTDWRTTNALLTLMARLLRTHLLSNKRFTESFIPSLVPLLESRQVTDGLFELLADLFRAGCLPEEGTAEMLFGQIVQQLEQLTSNSNSRALRHAMQILQKLQKLIPSSRGSGCTASGLKPDVFVRIVSRYVVLSEPEEGNSSLDSQPRTDSVGNNGYEPDSAAAVVDTLTLLAQIVSSGGSGGKGGSGDWLQRYSYLLSQPNVQQCLAAAILHGDGQVKQAALALVGTLGFSTDSVAGLSQALDQLSSINGQARRNSSAEHPLVHWTLSSPSCQAQRIDKLAHKVNQSVAGLHELKRCELLELMELQLERRKREEIRLRAELDTVGLQLADLRVSHIQIQSENDRMMSLVLAKSELVENKEAENRGLSRRLEKMQLDHKTAETSWRKERERMMDERKELERAHAETSAQSSAQLDAARKQIAALIAKSQEMDSQLEEALKAAQGYKASAEKRERRLEKLGQELKESQAQGESLRKSLTKREKEVEEKEREINTFKQQLKKSEMVREDVEARLVESEKTCRETKEELAKLEKIQEFIFELSSGKKKIFEEK